MSEQHTADLGTRYRYREEGRKFEIERREAWLNRVRTWYPEKANIWYEGYEMATNDIIKLIRDRVAQAKEYGKTGRITAMQKDVTFEDLEAISEAIIYGIEKESK